MSSFTRHYLFFLLFFSFLSLATIEPVFALGEKNKSYPVAMRTYGVWRVDEKERIDIAVWYPAKARGRAKELEGWTVPNAGTTPVQSGFFPIILVSHDTASSRFANNDISIAIASAGNIVIAVTHNNDNVISSEALYTASLLAERPRQLLIALETILDSPELGPHADESRIGLLGIGFGAITAMQILGKAPKIEDLDSFCSHLSSPDIFCNSWSGHKLRDIPKEIPDILDIYGSQALTPPLDLFSPELERISTIVKPESKTIQEQSKKGMYTAIKEWLSKKEDEETELPEVTQAERKEELLIKKEIAPQKETSIIVDFQGGELLGGTLLGYTFVNFPSKNDFEILSAEEEVDEPVIPIAPSPPRIPDNRTHHRLPSVRKIRSIALLAPAGGMLFNDYEPSDIPVAIVIAEKDLLYPYKVHALPYESLFSKKPQTKIVPMADHFSLFAPCSNDLAIMLGEVCGTIKGDDREQLNISNDKFLSMFFYSTLGGTTKEPVPSGFVAKPIKKHIKKEVDTANINSFTPKE